jgi:hypothetical protein
VAGAVAAAQLYTLVVMAPEPLAGPAATDEEARFARADGAAAVTTGPADGARRSPA